MLMNAIATTGAPPCTSVTQFLDALEQDRLTHAIDGEKMISMTTASPIR